jgi:hypothetical protein
MDALLDQAGFLAAEAFTWIEESQPREHLVTPRDTIRNPD